MNALKAEIERKKKERAALSAKSSTQTSDGMKLIKQSDVIEARQQHLLSMQRQMEEGRDVSFEGDWCG